MKVGSDDEAMDLMNDTEFGLTAAVFTKGQEAGAALLKRANSGTGYLNCCDRVSPFSLWSGRGGSGLDTTLGKIGIASFTQPKAYA